MHRFGERERVEEGNKPLRGGEISQGDSGGVRGHGGDSAKDRGRPSEKQDDDTGGLGHGIQKMQEEGWKQQNE